MISSIWKRFHTMWRFNIVPADLHHVHIYVTWNTDIWVGRFLPEAIGSITKLMFICPPWKVACAPGVISPWSFKGIRHWSYDEDVAFQRASVLDVLERLCPICEARLNDIKDAIV